MRFHTPLLALCLAAVLPAAAQAPNITEAGDPSVRSDTIYRLAVDPDDHPEESYVYLLDDGVVRVEPDGTGSRTYRYVVQVLTPEAVRAVRDVPKIRPEPYMAVDSNRVYMSIDAGGRTDWAGVARGTEPRERLPELVAFFEAMSADDAVFIVAEPAGA